VFRSSFCTALVLLLSLTSCRDEAAEAFARADLQYRELVAQAARPDDARFDAVLAELGKVPASSKHFAAAQKLGAAIAAGRGKKVRTPLAVAGNGHRPAQLEAQLEACARLAEMAGADGGVDRHALEGLEACRLRAEKLELSLSHGDEHVEVDGGEP
jgi:hypothetical protein